MSSMDMSGEWIGHYIQEGREYPISADFAQMGEWLTGTMHDGQPDRDCSLSEVAAQAGAPAGACEEIEARLREMVPGAPNAQIRYVSRLPSGSIVEGRVSGQTVSFLKTYQGTSFGGYRVGDRLLGIERVGHAVHYEGQLSADNMKVEGRWWIDADPVHATRRIEGEFRLRRPEGGQVPGEQQPRAADSEDRPWWKRWFRPKRGLTGQEQP